MAAAIEARFGRRRQAPAPGLLFAFTGGAGASPRMGQGLYRAAPVFAAGVDACAPLVQEHAGIDILPGFRGAERQDEPFQRRRMREIVELGVVQVALLDLWESHGVVPDAVAGVSLGEMTAAHAAGALSREDLVRVLCALAREVSRHVEPGTVFLLQEGSDGARRIAARVAGPVQYLGAVSPETTVLLVPEDRTSALAAELREQRVEYTHQPTSWPYHTMRAPYDRAALAAELGDIRPEPARLPVFSATAGRDISPRARFDAAHWSWMIGHPYHYDEAVAAAYAAGHRIVVSIGAHPQLNAAMAATAAAAGVDVLLVASMRSDEDEAETFERAMRAVSTARRTRARRPANGASAGFSLLDPLVAEDPYAVYRRWRRRGPVVHVNEGTWIVVGHAQVRSALGDPALFLNAQMTAVEPAFLGSTGARHSAARSAAARGLALQAQDGLRERTRREAVRLLEQTRERPELEVARDLAGPLARFVTGRLLALDDAQIERLRLATAGLEEEADIVAAALAAVDATPPISLPPAFAEHMEGVDPAAVRAMPAILWGASTVTSQRAITAAVGLLACSTELRRRLLETGSLVAPFVEEALRLHPPVHFVNRSVTAATCIGGEQLPAGATARLCLAAANRDPEVFHSPDEVVLERTGRHLAFGSGAHGCIGAQTARILIAAAIEALLETFPDFELVQPRCTWRYATSHASHSLASLTLAGGAR